MAFAHRTDHSTISGLARDVAQAIWHNLSSEHLLFPDGATKWKLISKDFMSKWNFPHCVGALDGKHISIVAPKDSGSEFFNYKGTFSIVLMALVDANLKFTGIEVGAPGRYSDGGIFSNSNLGKGFLNGSFALPAKEPLPGAEHLGTMPYVIVADEAFPLKECIMRPYPGRGQSHEQRVYNYRLSRARRTSENAFGLLASRWRVFHTKIATELDLTIPTVKAACVLHNMLIDHNPSLTSTSTDEEECPFMLPLSHQGINATRKAQCVRDTFRDYFAHHDQLDWQDSHVRRGKKH